MTSEQVTELGQALEILSAKSSVMKERTELRKLIEENKTAEEEVSCFFFTPSSALSALRVEHEWRTTADHSLIRLQGGKPNPLAKRLKSILAKIDSQLEEYDNSVGSRLNMFEVDYQGRIAVKDLKIALESIAHRPSDEAIDVLLQKLDVDGDRFVPLDDIVALAEGEGLGIVISEEGAVELSEDVNSAADELKAVGGSVREKKTGEELKEEKRSSKEKTLRKEDVVSD